MVQHEDHGDSGQIAEGEGDPGYQRVAPRFFRTHSILDTLLSKGMFGIYRLCLLFAEIKHEMVFDRETVREGLVERLNLRISL